MDLAPMLEDIREYYVNHFVDTVNEHTAADDATIVYEAAFCDDKGQIATEGQLDLPARGDLIVVRDGLISDSIQIDTEGMVSFEALSFDWPGNGVKVELSPFQWNWLQLRIYGLQPDTDWAPLCDWFKRWFRENDPADGELLDGIHFMSDPEDVGGCAQLAIDLGTAPIESFQELVDALGPLGADRVEIGQFDIL
jgi:hypothetical protein